MAASVIAVLGTLLDMKIAARREGLPDTVEARRLRYAASKSVTQARGRVRMATRDHELLAAVHTAVGTTFALGEAADDAAVQEAGARARAAHDALEEVAAHRVFDAR